MEQLKFIPSCGKKKFSRGTGKLLPLSKKEYYATKRTENLLNSQSAEKGKITAQLNYFFSKIYGWKLKQSESMSNSALGICLAREVRQTTGGFHQRKSESFFSHITEFVVRELFCFPVSIWCFLKFLALPNCSVQNIC